MVDRHKQQIKRDRQDLKRREINSQNKSRMRTLIKSVLSEKDAEKAKNSIEKIANKIREEAAKYDVYFEKADYADKKEPFEKVTNLFEKKN